MLAGVAAAAKVGTKGPQPGLSRKLLLALEQTCSRFYFESYPNLFQVYRSLLYHTLQILN